jgi:hypothetical protein
MEITFLLTNDKIKRKMKTKLIIKGIGLATLMTLLFALSSCSKSADEYSTKDQKELQDKNLESTPIDGKNFAESNEDLTTVDYKEFYEQLSPHGEWIEISYEEIGLQAKTTESKNANNSGSPLTDLPWIEDAAASVGNSQLVYVWKPSPSLAVTSTAGTAPGYMPYANGQWVNTDAGWYFKGATPVEETVSHYGRWVNSPTAGWLWVPGRVWAPAWVDWKQNDEYVSWAPLPPSVSLINDLISPPVINDNDYVIVQRKYFLEPDLYKYRSTYFDNGKRILVSDMKWTEGIIVVNNTIVNKGPDVHAIQNLYGRNIELIKIKHAENLKDAKYSDKEFNVYTLNFKRYKNNGNTKFTINEPKSFKKYDDWKVKKSEEKESKKESKEDEKEIKKGNNGDDNGNKHNNNDDGKKNDDKNNGKDNEKKNNGKNNDNGKDGKKNGNDNKKSGK